MDLVCYWLEVKEIKITVSVRFYARLVNRKAELYMTVTKKNASFLWSRLMSKNEFHSVKYSSISQ